MRPLPSLRKPDPTPSETEPAPPEVAPPEAPRPQFRVSLKMLLVLMTIVAVPIAAWGGMRRAGVDRTFYVIFATAAPVLVLLLVGLLHQLTHRRPR